MPLRSDHPGIEYPVTRAAVSLMLCVLLLLSAAFPAVADDAEALRSFLQSH